MTLPELTILALQISILLTVFGFGLQATLTDAAYLLRRPSLLARSLLAMFVIMPVIAWSVGRLFVLRPAVDIVLVALAISPVPPLLPMKELKAGGRVSYVFGLMVVASAMSLVVVPVWLYLFSLYTVHPVGISLGTLARTVMISALLPLLGGMALRAVAPGVAERLVKPTGTTAKVLLVVCVAIVLFSAMPAAISLAGDGAVVTMAAFVVAGLAVGHWLGGPVAEERLVLALSTASRHPALALTIAKANYPDEAMLGPAVVLYLLINFIVVIPYILRLRKVTAPVAGAT